MLFDLRACVPFTVYESPVLSNSEDREGILYISL